MNRSALLEILTVNFNIAPFLRAYQWFAIHWKVWGIPALLLGAARYLKMWFDLRKAHQDLKNSQLEGKRLQGELEKLDREKAAAERQVAISKTEADIEDLLSALPANRIWDITPGPGDDPEIFKEALRRWNRRKQDRMQGKIPARFAGRF